MRQSPERPGLASSPRRLQRLPNSEAPVGARSQTGVRGVACPVRRGLLATDMPGLMKEVPLLSFERVLTKFLHELRAFRNRPGQAESAPGTAGVNGRAARSEPLRRATPSVIGFDQEQTGVSRASAKGQCRGGACGGGAGHLVPGRGGARHLVPGHLVPAGRCAGEVPDTSFGHLVRTPRSGKPPGKVPDTSFRTPRSAGEVPAAEVPDTSFPATPPGRCPGKVPDTSFGKEAAPGRCQTPRSRRKAPDTPFGNRASRPVPDTSFGGRDPHPRRRARRRAQATCQTPRSDTSFRPFRTPRSGAVGCRVVS